MENRRKLRASLFEIFARIGCEIRIPDWLFASRPFRLSRSSSVSLSARTIIARCATRNSRAVLRADASSLAETARPKR